MSRTAVREIDRTHARAGIGYDLPCEGCRYNLRGLTPPGCCPECGLDLGVTLAAREGRTSFDAERRRLRERLERPPTPWEAREVAWGCALLLLLAIVPILIFAAAPADAEDMRSRRDGQPRRALLSQLCASWVLTWYATLKLTRGDRRRRGGTLNDGLSSWLIVFSTGYAVLPCVAAVPTLFEMLGGADPRARRIEWEGGLLLFLAFAGVVASALLPAWLRVLARRVGRPRVAREAAVLAAFSPVAHLFSIVVLLNSPSGARGPNSLDLLGVLPHLPFGPPLLYRTMLAPERAYWDGGSVLVVITVLAVAAWNVSVLLKVYAAHLPGCRAAAALEPFSSGEDVTMVNAGSAGERTYPVDP